LKTGYYISGIGHGLLILVLLFGGLFSRESDEPTVPVADVSIISSEEFAALTSPEQGTPEPVEETPPTATPEPTPEPEPLPVEEPQPEPQVPDPVPETPDAPVDDTPTPPDVDRVAPEIVEAPEEPVEVAPEVIEEVAPSEEPAEVVEPEPEVDAAQPEASTTEIVTEAEEPASAAPSTSIRPQPRPLVPPSQVAETPEAEPETPAEPARDPLADAVNDAVNDALDTPTETATNEGASDTPAPVGPPLTSGEREGLRVAVSQCWNLGSSSTDAMKTTVVVMVEMEQNGRPAGIRLVSSNGPNDAATNAAFEAARRAVIRCGANGFDLPAEKYGQWQQIEMTFNPEQMRMR
jgi:hypothetical protein